MRAVTIALACICAALGWAGNAAARPDGDRRPPRLVSAVVSGTTARLTFSEALARRAIPSREVLAAADGRPLAPRASVRGRVLTLALRAAWGDEVVRIRLSRRAVRDRAGNWFCGATVTAANRSPAGCAPTLAGSGRYTLSTNTERTLFLASTGPVRAVMVFVDFPDAPSTHSTQALRAALGDRAAGYFDHVSSGRFGLAIDAYPDWVRMPRRSDEYGLDEGMVAERYHELLREAFAAADPVVDFRPYDVVYFVHSADSAVNTTGAFTSGRGGGFRVDGTEKRWVAAIDARNPEVPRALTLIHETLHFLGLPDLYLFQRITWDSAMYSGAWDVMSIPKEGVLEPVAWHRWKLGWLGPTEVRCARPGRVVDVELSPLGIRGGTKAVVVRESAGAVYVIENRQHVGLDWGICRPGVLVYRVDGTIPNGHGPLRVVPAEPDTDMGEVARCRSNYAAAFSLDGVRRLDNPAVPFVLELLEGSPGGAIRVRVTPR